MKTGSSQIRHSAWLRERKSKDPSAFDIGRAAVRARTGLARSQPHKSMFRPAGRTSVGILLLSLVVFAGQFVWTQSFGWLTAFSGILMAGLGLIRIAACCFPMPQDEPLKPIDTLDVVPDWTILIALYKEAGSVKDLLAALEHLEWDPKKRDLIFACERDDHETIAALTACRRHYQFRIIRVPNGGPRTKPNALQTALPFARGRFLTVYDAEDRPEPTQLRAAFRAFSQGPGHLAVVQAPLVTWNHDESWIARQFALDYAIWFRVMLPFLSRLSGVLPLGGTSNHFRTDVLRQVGGWDPYNVTEDADLGIRLARWGYSATLIDPPTFEEAPPLVGAWVKQRGRWIQGHIQTFCLHLRHPIALISELKVTGILGFVLGLGLGPLAALYTLPIMIGAFAILLDGRLSVVDLAVVFGALSHCFVGFIAAKRDGRTHLWRATLSQPFYFCLQTIAACRALWRVVFTPSIWDKTDHGCAARQTANSGDRRRLTWIF